MPTTCRATLWPSLGREQPAVVCQGPPTQMPKVADRPHSLLDQVAPARIRCRRRGCAMMLEQSLFFGDTTIQVGLPDRTRLVAGHPVAVQSPARKLSGCLEKTSSRRTTSSPGSLASTSPARLRPRLPRGGTEHALRHRRRLMVDPRPVDLRPQLVHLSVVGLGGRCPLDDVTAEA